MPSGRSAARNWSFISKVSRIGLQQSLQAYSDVVVFATWCLQDDGLWQGFLCLNQRLLKSQIQRIIPRMSKNTENVKVLRRPHAAIQAWRTTKTGCELFTFGHFEEIRTNAMPRVQTDARRQVADLQAEIDEYRLEVVRLRAQIQQLQRQQHFVVPQSVVIPIVNNEVASPMSLASAESTSLPNTPFSTQSRS